jgi:hypothetical protein
MVEYKKLKPFLIGATMKKSRIFIIITILALILAACSQPATNTSIPTGEPAQPNPTQPAEPVTSDALMNGSYPIRDGSVTVQLAGGKYEAGQGADYVQVTLLPDIAYGDLNQDGIPDAAVILAENYGGSGTFLSLVPVLAKAGGAQPEKGASLGDRVQVKSLVAEDRVVKVNLLVQAPNDTMCCPTLPQSRTYEYRVGSGLFLLDVTSQTADGNERSITIDLPAPGSEVASPMLLKGSVTIAPFENNLVVNLYDASGTQVSAGPLAVNAAEMGGPGTFESQVDLAAASVPSGLVRVEVVDQSPADGSILALAAVYVVYK